MQTKGEIFPILEENTTHQRGPRTWPTGLRHTRRVQNTLAMMTFYPRKFRGSHGISASSTDSQVLPVVKRQPHPESRREFPNPSPRLRFWLKSMAEGAFDKTAGTPLFETLAPKTIQKSQTAHQLGKKLLPQLSQPNRFLCSALHFDLGT